MSPGPARLLSLLIILSAPGLASAQARGQVGLTETLAAPLGGSASAPSLLAAPSRLLLEGYDSAGRLVLLGRGSGGGEGAAPSYREFRYDDRGRLLAILERAEPEGPVLRGLRRRFDAEGRLLAVELEEAELPAARLELVHEGSGRAGLAFLRSASGELLEAGRFVLGGGAAEGALLHLELLGPEGEEAGFLSLAYDGGGRLTRYERGGGPAAEEGEAAKAVSAPAPAPAAAPATPAPGEAAPGSAPGPDIPSLLFPLWPGEGPGFELAFLLAIGPRGRLPPPASPFASGFSGLPFGPPSEGLAEFLYDGAGRLLEASLEASGGGEAGAAGTSSSALGLSYRYDEAGLLVAEELREAGARTGLLHVYRLGPRGAWTERSSFLRAPGPAPLEPLEYRSRGAAAPRGLAVFTGR